MTTVYAENLVDGHRTLPVLLDDLRSATRAIHVAMFLFFDDPIGEEIERLLEEKARAGVAVRVLLNVEKTKLGDPFSTGEERMMREDPDFRRDPTDIDDMRKRLEKAGVRVLDTNLDYDRIVTTGEPELDRIGAEIREAIDVDDLHIDHRKLVLVDGRVGYCGSANFGAQYLFHRPFEPGRHAHDEANEAREKGLPEPWWKWHDGLVRFEGAIVHDLDVVFRERWVLGGGDRYVPLGPFPPSQRPRGIAIGAARIVKNEPSSRPNAIRAAFLERIAAAERSIFVENPYVYHPAIVDAFLAAKKKRPELRFTLVVPARTWNDNLFAQDAMQHHYAAYVDAGIDVYEYQGHFTHLKLATFDETWAVVGSANLNYRSLEDDKDFECCVVLESPDFVRAIHREVRDVDVRVSKRIGDADVHGVSLDAIRRYVRDPRTLAMIAAREL